MTDAIRRTVCLDLNRLSPDPAWPLMRQDLHAAVAILQRHAAAGEPLPFLEDWGEAADGERLWVRFPAWLRDLAEHYQPGLIHEMLLCEVNRSITSSKLISKVV